MKTFAAGRGILLVSAVFMLLPACTQLSAPAGVECEPLSTFRGETYLSYRTIDSRRSKACAETAFGSPIGSASPSPCQGLDTEGVSYTVYKIPHVDPADGILLVYGGLEVAVPSDLADKPDTWPEPLTTFMDTHPAATDM